MTFEEICQRYGVPYWTEGTGTRPGWINLDCPYCGGHLYLGYNIERRYFNCWKDGGLWLEGTISKLTGLRIDSEMRQLVSDLPREQIRDQEPRGTLQLPDNVSILLPQHRKYLKNRGFDPYTISKLWGVRGIAQSYKLSWRLFIPIMYNNEVVSWTTRSISDSVPDRYVSAAKSQEAMDSKKLLYGEDYCRDSICVVEGPTDVWRIGPGAAGTLGVGYTRAQLEKMSRYRRRMIVFDAEAQAQKRAQKLLNELEVFDGETYNCMLDSKDPGSASEGEVKFLRAFIEGGKVEKSCPIIC